MPYPLIDLHCDLLCYLAGDPTRTPLKEEVRCSLPQLKKGQVSLQTCAVFCETKTGSQIFARKQFECFSKLSAWGFQPFSSFENLRPSSPCVIAAIENASGLVDEEEPIARAFQRFNEYQELAGPLLYISMTWNAENRFGGGNMTQVGLKPDGERLLEFLDQRNVAIDLSHTSDWLAEGILNYIDKKNLRILPIASHSNFRAVMDHARNLPDEIAQEIICRGGIIGFNAVKKFVGTDFFDSIKRHLDHGCKLGGENNLCFGADFFYDGDIPPSLNSLKPFYDPVFECAADFPKLMVHLKDYYSETQLKNIASDNFSAFFRRLHSC